jgi:protein AATF/BFR2
MLLAEGMGLHSMKKLHSKKRKTVDRRASKGRKIRYTVHDPLVNFMAPELMVLPPMATKLFANLFGQQAPAS